MRTKRYCKCKCGEQVLWGNKYISGHNSRVTNPFKGKKHTEETKKHLSLVAKARPALSEETRKKISDKGKGRSVSKETRRKLSENRLGDKHPMWKGGVRKSNGRIYLRTGPNRQYKARARLVVEELIGRELESSEIVHHINGVPDDDRLENLVITDRTSHVREHHTGAKRSEITKRLIGEATKRRNNREDKS